MPLPRSSLLVWGYLLLLTAAIATGLLTAIPQPQDDHFLYQKFIEALAAGKFDLTIPGFHGTDLFGFIVFLITHSPIAQVYGLMIPAIALPILGYVAGKSLYKDEWSGILLATIIAMMPFISFVLLRGWTGPGYWAFMLLTVIGASRKSWWTGIAWALAILSKPFAIILLPLIVVLYTKEKRHSKKLSPFLFPLSTAFALVALYFLIQYLQAGQIFVGAHSDITITSMIQTHKRVLLNLAHSLQILFSVHNYYYPTPALTGPGNLMHTSPVLIFLGLFALLSPAVYFKDKRIAYALLGGAIAGILMNAHLDHMDHFYMEASVLLLLLASVPVLSRHRLWTPIALATLHFQYFYFWLQYAEGFALTWWFWAVPALVDLCFLAWGSYSLWRVKSSA